MLPETASSLIALAVFIVPGLVFEMRRERHRPAMNRTPFREVSVVVLASVMLGLVGLAALGLLRLAGATWIIDFADWLRSPKSYVESHSATVAFTVGLQTAVSSAVAFAVDFAWEPTADARRKRREDSGKSLRSSNTTSPHTVWWTAFQATRPTGKSQVFVDVRMKSGKTISGALSSHTTGDESSRDLLLAHHEITPVVCFDGLEALPLTTANGERSLVVVNGADVEWIIVGHRRPT